MTEKSINISVINGPNTNLFGQRDKKQYGSITISDIENLMLRHKNTNTNLIFMQSNSEGELIDYIQNAIKQNHQGIIINPAGYTHTSIAIADALDIFTGTKVEVHISNIFNREDIRRNSVTGKSVHSIFTGAREYSYICAMQYIEYIN